MSQSDTCFFDRCSSNEIDRAVMAPSRDPQQSDSIVCSCAEQTENPRCSENTSNEEATKVNFNLELPSILLTPDGMDNKCQLGGSTESLNAPTSVEHIKHQRLSYNSLLHWNKSPSKNDLEYLLNKYSELEGKIFTVEIPLSQIAVEVGHAKPPQLGLCLAGNRDLNQMSVFVCGIRPGSLVERDGRIQLGDQLLEVNDHILYGLSHLNAAPIIRSVYLEVVKGSNRIFQRTKLGSIRFVVQRYTGNLTAMAVTASHTSEIAQSDKSSRRSSAETVLSVLSSPQRTGYDNSKAKRSLEFMELAFGDKRGPLVEHTVFITLSRGSSGFGFAIMEGSPTKEEGIYVKQLIEDGPAAKDGRLCPGDQLIRVNRRDATHASYETVLEWIRSTKHELRLQVKRLCFRSQIENQQQQGAPLLRNQKRFSAPHLLGTLAVAFRGGGGETQTRRPRSSQDQRDSLGSGKVALEPVLENDDVCMSHLIPSPLSSKLRRASSPNLQSWHNESQDHAARLQINTDLTEHGAQADHRGSICTIKSTSSTVRESRLAPAEPVEPAATRPILSGTDTVIELEVEPGRGLGIGFIGGSETALNVLVVHELYAKGLAVKDARLRPGDQIIRVNNTPLVGVPFGEAMKRVYSAYNEVLPKTVSNPSGGGGGCEKPPEATETAEVPDKSPHVLTLEVRRPETDQSIKWYDQEVTVELCKKSGKGLGICIADRCVYSGQAEIRKENGKVDNGDGTAKPAACTRNPSYGVVITELIRGSMAATDGRLQVNDQILSVNGTDMRLSNSEVVSALLKTASSKITIKVGRLKNQVSIASTAFHGYLPPS